MTEINDNFFEERKKEKERADEEFIEKAGVGDGMGKFILDKWEELMGEVYHGMYTVFPEQMNVEMINLLLERERKVE